MGGKNDNDRVGSPESASIHLKVPKMKTFEFVKSEDPDEEAVNELTLHCLSKFDIAWTKLPSKFCSPNFVIYYFGT